MPRLKLAGAKMARAQTCSFRCAGRLLRQVCGPPAPSRREGRLLVFRRAGRLLVFKRAGRLL
eukprot:5154704-Pleurochrysis_carterae.AAC.1